MAKFIGSSLSLHRITYFSAKIFCVCSFGRLFLIHSSDGLLVFLKTRRVCWRWCRWLDGREPFTMHIDYVIDRLKIRYDKSETETEMNTASTAVNTKQKSAKEKKAKFCTLLSVCRVYGAVPLHRIGGAHCTVVLQFREVKNKVGLFPQLEKLNFQWTASIQLKWICCQSCNGNTPNIKWKHSATKTLDLMPSAYTFKILLYQSLVCYIFSLSWKFPLQQCYSIECATVWT